MKLFPVYSLYPARLVKANGCTLWDAAGNRYLDMYGGHAVISIGHGHPVYVKALQEQLERIAFYSNAVASDEQDAFASLLGDASGYPDYSLFLCNSGAEANENALKIAAFHTGRSRVLCFDGAFHGRTAAAVELTDIPAYHSSLNRQDWLVRVPLNDAEALKAAFAAHGHELAAAIVEGIQGVAGIVVPTHGFLQLLRQLCTQHGVPLILDEIQSGCGRTGLYFAHQYAGIEADLITVAKGIGNGFPMSAVLISPAFTPRIGMLGTTFGGNYLACAAGIAVLNVMQQERLAERAAEAGAWLKQELATLSAVKEVRGQGLILGLALDRPAKPVAETLVIQERMFCGTAGAADTLRLLPPLTISDAELEQAVASIKRVLSV